MQTSPSVPIDRLSGLRERFRVQAVNDCIVFGTVACTALGSGLLHEWLGWEAVNLLLLPALALALWRVSATRPALA